MTTKPESGEHEFNECCSENIVLVQQVKELERQLAEARERINSAIAAAEAFQEASRKKGLRLESVEESLRQIATLPLGDHQAKKIADSALKSP